MEHTLLSFLGRHLRTSLLVGAVFSAFGFLSVLFLMPAYSVRTDYFITQEDAGTKDYYEISRSAEYMSKVLSEVVGSERFIAAVIDTGRTKEGFLPRDKKEKLASWKRMVRIGKRLDLGIVSVTVSSDDLDMAERVALGVSEVFIDHNGAFLGTGDRNIPVSVLSGPIAERNPGLPTVVLSVVGGFVGGFLLSLSALSVRDGLAGTKRGTAFRSRD
jgi:capsular polysaccharide biosynthesis protein